MNVLDAIKGRRSVRCYESRVVDDATIRALLDAAVAAPSAMNAQPLRFAIVQNASQLRRYSDRAKQMLLAQAPPDPKTQLHEDRLSSSSFNIFYDATTLIAIGVDVRSRYTDGDAWLAAENLMLAAHAAGLGTCAIGLALPALNLPEVRYELGIPRDGMVVAPIVVGHPRVVPERGPRLAPRIVSWSR
ncbi:MAG: nitroreductase family protein [Polyangiales bacterium]